MKIIYYYLILYTMKPVQFNMQKSKEFYETLKHKVKEYFDTQKKSDKGNRYLYSKAIILFTSWIGAYCLIVFVAQSVRAVIGSYIIFGVIGALIGFNIMHDGGHGWFSKKKRLNNLAWFSMNILWSNICFGKIQNNMLHHTYTNIDQYDDDIDSRPIFRFHPEQERKRFHKYQYLYFLPLYWLGTWSLMFYGDFRRYFQRTIGSFSLKKLPLFEHVLFRTTKLFMISLYFIIPAFAVGWWKALIGMVCMYFFMSMFLNTIFQLAHVLEKTSMVSHKDYKVEEHRAVHQLETTANFAMRNPVWTWLLGGLNFQVEHHLFPQISHVHYPKIARIVQQVCHQYWIPYHSYATVTSAFVSHVKYIKNMGRS